MTSTPKTITVPSAPTAPKTLGKIGAGYVQNTRWNQNLTDAAKGPAPSGFSYQGTNPQLSTWAHNITQSLRPSKYGYQQSGTSRNWGQPQQPGQPQPGPLRSAMTSVPEGMSWGVMNPPAQQTKGALPSQQQPIVTASPGAAPTTSGGLQQRPIVIPGFRGPGNPTGTVLHLPQPEPEQPSGAQSIISQMLTQDAAPGYGGFRAAPGDQGSVRRLTQGVNQADFGGYQGGPGDMGATARMTQGVTGPEFGGFQGGPSDLGTTSRMTQGVTSPEYGGYRNGPGGQDLQQRLSANLGVDPNTGFQTMDRTGEITDATGQEFAGYQNELQGTAEEKIRQDMNRTVQEGYDANYLKDLAASGIDPMTEAYDLAMKKASADFNRMGLGASGFEVEGKYGSQPDSITSRYLKEVSNVARDVGLRGAEAARDDRFRNADLQGQAVDRGSTLSGIQSDDSFRRTAAEMDQGVQRVGMLQNQDQTNEAARQQWGQFGLDRELADRDVAERGARLGSDLFQVDDQARGQWYERDLDKQKTNLDMAERGTRLGADLSQVAEQNRGQWYDRDVSNQEKNLDLANQAARLNQDLFQTNENARTNWFDRDMNAQTTNADLAERAARLSTDLFQAEDQARGQWYERDISNQQRNKDNLERGFGMANTLDQQDQKAQQYWNEDDLTRQKMDKDNLARGFDMGMSIQNRDDSQQQYYDSAQLDRDKTANQRILDATRMGMDYDQTDEANAQWWSNYAQGQAQQDFQNESDLWGKQTDYGFKEAARQDDIRKFDVERQIEVDKANQDVRNANVQNLLSFLNLQGTTGGQMQKDFFDAYRNAGPTVADNNQAMTDTGAWLGDLFGFGRQDPVKNPATGNAPAQVERGSYGIQNPAPSSGSYGVQANMLPAMAPPQQDYQQGNSPMAAMLTQEAQQIPALRRRITRYGY